MTCTTNLTVNLRDVLLISLGTKAFQQKHQVVLEFERTVAGIFYEQESRVITISMQYKQSTDKLQMFNLL